MSELRQKIISILAEFGTSVQGDSYYSVLEDEIKDYEAVADLEALFQSELEKAEKRGYAAGVKADKQAVSEIVEKAKKDEAGNIYKMAEDIVLAKPASSIVAGGTDLDKLMNQLERKYGKDLIQHVYGDHNKLESQKERIDK